MGHYYSEMGFDKSKSSYDLNREKRMMLKDISDAVADVIDCNELDILEINLGDKVKLFSGLFDREIPHADSFGDYTLADYVDGYILKNQCQKGEFGYGRVPCDKEFEVYQIDNNRVRLTSNSKYCCSSLFEVWADVKYFERE